MSTNVDENVESAKLEIFVLGLRISNFEILGFKISNFTNFTKIQILQNVGENFIKKILISQILCPLAQVPRFS